MLETLWNSVQAISKALNYTQLALIIFGLVTLGLTTLQYKLSLRKDYLSGASQKQREEALNERISQTAQTATKSVNDLIAAKANLLDTQTQLAVVAHKATDALNQLADATKTLSHLKAQASKLSTLSLRVVVTTTTLGEPKDLPATHYMDTGPACALAGPASTVILLYSKDSNGFQDGTNRSYSADLGLADRNLIAGQNISMLEHYTILAVGVGAYLDRLSLLERTSAVTRVQAFLNINGTELPLVTQDIEVPVSNNKALEVHIDVSKPLVSLTKRYRDLMIK